MASELGGSSSGADSSDPFRCCFGHRSPFPRVLRGLYTQAVPSVLGYGTVALRVLGQRWQCTEDVGRAPYTRRPNRGQKPDWSGYSRVLRAGGQGSQTGA